MKAPFIIAAAAWTVVVALAPSVRAEPVPDGGDPAAEVRDEGPPTPYYQGRMRIGANGGATTGSGGSSFYLAASFGIFMVDNLELGVDAAFWFGDPFVAPLGPSLRYILPVSEQVHPYLGAFYRHTFIGSGFDDVDGLGVRGGVLIYATPVFFQLGVAYEWIVSECHGPVCDDWYPELGISFFL